MEKRNPFKEFKYKTSPKPLAKSSSRAESEMTVNYSDLMKIFTTPPDEQRCIGCDTPVNEIKWFWKYVTTPFGFKPLCLKCAVERGISLD